MEELPVMEFRDRKTFHDWLDKRSQISGCTPQVWLLWKLRKNQEIGTGLTNPRVKSRYLPNFRISPVRIARRAKICNVG